MTARLLRRLGADRARLTAAGFGFSHGFMAAMDDLQVAMLELEFDLRRPQPGPTHYVLTNAGMLEGFDVAVCTEVIEHQMHPLSLLVGINRSLVPGGRLLLTTNSAAFIGDVLKLASGRQRRALGAEPCAQGRRVASAHPDVHLA